MNLTARARFRPALLSAKRPTARSNLVELSESDPSGFGSGWMAEDGRRRKPTFLYKQEFKHTRLPQMRMSRSVDWMVSSSSLVSSAERPRPRAGRKGLRPLPRPSGRSSETRQRPTRTSTRKWSDRQQAHLSIK